MNDSGVWSKASIKEVCGTCRVIFDRLMSSQSAVGVREGTNDDLNTLYTVGEDRIRS